MRLLPATLVALIVALIGGPADAGIAEAWAATAEGPGIERSVPGAPGDSPSLPGLAAGVEADAVAELESETRSGPDGAPTAMSAETRVAVCLVRGAASKVRAPADAPSPANPSRAPPHV